MDRETEEQAAGRVMTEYISTKAIVLKTSNLGEYDKRMVVLTADMGKITVFARGVRRQGSAHLAACSPFSYGELRAFPGRNAYTMVSFQVENYFEALRTDFDISCMGMYFLEVSDHYSRENNDDLEMMKLLYVSLRALERLAKEGGGDKDLLRIRLAFEMKAIAVNGEFEGAGALPEASPGLVSALNHIALCSVKALYAFDVNDELLSELEAAGAYFRDRYLQGNFRSLELATALT